MAVVDEEVLQPREPFGVADPEIAGLELVAQLSNRSTTGPGRAPESGPGSSFIVTGLNRPLG
jgi:hypothetical protein